MQPMAQCNTPHRSLQCNTLRCSTVRFDPLCVNATLISQIHTCGAILLPQWQHKCNQIWCIVSFQKVERTRYKHLIAQIRIFLWSTVHFKMTEIYRSNPPMWRIKEQEHFLVPTGCPKIDLVNFIQGKRFIFWLWPIDQLMQVVKVESRGSILSPIRLLSACQSTSSLCQLGRKKGTIIRLNNIGNNNNNNNNKNSNNINNKKWPPLRKKTQLFYLFIVNTN